MNVYRLNKIPCVYLFPENLGIIKYVFDKRIQIELFNNGLLKELYKYRRDKLFNSDEFHLRAGGIFVTLFFIVDKGILPKHITIGDIILLSIISLFGLFQLYYLIKVYHRIFTHNKFTLDQLDYDYFG